MTKLEFFYFLGQSTILSIMILAVYVTRSPIAFIVAVLGSFAVPLIWRQIVCTAWFQQKTRSYG